MVNQKGIPNFCQFFPPEVIEQVFTQLNVKEMNACMEVCRRFESIITNSPVLMKKFKVRWGVHRFENKDQMALMPTSKRKYSKISFYEILRCGLMGVQPISRDNMRAIVQFVENQSRTLKSLVMRMTSGDLYEILSAAPDIESLQIGWFGFHKNAQLPIVSMQKLKSLTVSCRSSDSLSWLWSQTMRLEYFCFGERLTRRATESLIPFLQSQEHLKKIFIEIVDLKDLLGDREVASSMKFKAKIIRLEHLKPESIQLPYLTLFLGTQKSSLEELELQKISLFDNDVDSLLKLALTKLELTKCTFIAPGRSTVINKSIQSLKVAACKEEGDPTETSNEKIRAITKILQSCQAVDTLELLYFNFEVELSQTIASMKTLQALNLYGCKLTRDSALNFPSLKVLTIKLYRANAASRQFKALNPQLETFVCEKDRYNNYVNSSDSENDD